MVSRVSRSKRRPCGAMAIDAPDRRLGAPPPRSAASTWLSTDHCELVLLRCRVTARTSWAFTERVEDAPPLAAGIRVDDVLRSSDGQMDTIASRLIDDSFVVVDNFLSQSSFVALRDEVAAVKTAGHLQASELAGGPSGSSTAYTLSALRGDHIGWFDGGEAHTWPRDTLRGYLLEIDALMGKLRQLPQLPQLASVVQRSRAMVACYPGGGARYRRHCDNACSASVGERCNGRRLTAILYANEDWVPSDGGALRLYEPFDPDAAEATLRELREWVAAHKAGTVDEDEVARVLPELRAKLKAVSLDDGPARCDVAPLANRLVLFFSDYAVPHEVLPAFRERLAVTVWYFDEPEHERALATGEAADSVVAIEAEAIGRLLERAGACKEAE